MEYLGNKRHCKGKKHKIKDSFGDISRSVKNADVTKVNENTIIYPTNANNMSQSLKLEQKHSKLHITA